MADDKGHSESCSDGGVSHNTPQSGPRRERDPGACERCNCHHHTTEDHDRWSREGPPDFGPTMGDDW